MQRLRIKFSRGEELKYLSHLDLTRLWERACRRAGIALAYSEGFTPHPRISLAVPLSVGITSEAELMDLFLVNWSAPNAFINQMGRELPQGIRIGAAHSINTDVPSLQSQVTCAEYEVTIKTGMSECDIKTAITHLLSLNEFPWHHYRDTGIRRYDIRALIEDIWIIDYRDSFCSSGMRLRCDNRGTGRPEQVVKALGFSHYPIHIHRTKLLLQ